MISGIKGKLLLTYFISQNIKRQITFFLDLLNDIRLTDDYVQLKKNNE